jgi:hypothetical protein
VLAQKLDLLNLLDLMVNKPPARAACLRGPAPDLLVWALYALGCPHAQQGGYRLALMENISGTRGRPSGNR